MKTKLIAFLLISFLLFSCQSSKPGRFAVQTPATWIVKDTVDAKGARYIKMHSPVEIALPAFVSNINISVMKFFNLDMYISGVLKGVKADAKYFKEKGRGSVKINSYDMEWEQHLIQLKSSPTLVEQKVYFVWDGGDIYQIVCSTRPNKMPEIQKEIDTVLNSFKIL